MAATGWVIHVVPQVQVELVTRFATKGIDKFAGTKCTATEHGHPVLEGASAVLVCSPYSRHDAGDHKILVASVDQVELGDTSALVYFQREFHQLSRLNTAPRAAGRSLRAK